MELGGDLRREQDKEGPRGIRNPHSSGAHARPAVGSQWRVTLWGKQEETEAQGLQITSPKSQSAQGCRQEFKSGLLWHSGLFDTCHVLCP